MKPAVFITGAMPSHKALRIIEVPEEIRCRFSGKRPIIQLLEDIIMVWNGWKFTVFTGLIYDGSSDPWFLPRFSQTDRGADSIAGIHDGGYRAAVELAEQLGMTLREFRKFIDRAYYYGGIANKEPKWMMQVRYVGIRLFGWVPFNWYAKHPTNPEGLITIEAI